MPKRKRETTDVSKSPKTKPKRKQKAGKTIETAKEVPVIPAATRGSDQQPPKRIKWTNKQRVLVFSSRGTGFRARHLMTDIRSLMPHAKSENKMNKNDKLIQINEACEMKNCNWTLYFESRKKKDLYLWMAKVPDGPSAKFLVENIHTMDELKMTGNCLKGSRPLLSFHKDFEFQPHLALLREMFAQAFNTPNHHPKSQPFFDRVMCFSIADNRIWIRNFQIVEEDGALAEIGPRLTLNLIKIFAGSFRGECLYENPLYVSPNLHRRSLKMAAAGKYINRVEVKADREQRMPETAYPVENEMDDVFRRAEQAKQKPLDDEANGSMGEKSRTTPKKKNQKKRK
ncbi:ribosome biogenesis protein BRX1 homolog [Paramacrobiotus metropolitanus]|uniref:ribosome biogenesis protein BRX1 homolog n=1 Tax=Paramacrobiotus metropolitanus TaxID=2943436 RepID=UPI002445E157|nr:ribosome biogenesis protein BRX1 homolog [Paramacrobiotus metropolitanus]